MAQQNSRQSGGNKRAQGGGRTANNEPKVQVFKGFMGMNFQNSAFDVVNTADNGWKTDHNQTDLMMVNTEYQSNVSVVPGLTLETTPDLRRMRHHIDMKWLEAHAEETGNLNTRVVFRGPAALVGNYLFLAFSLYSPSTSSRLEDGDFLGKINIRDEHHVLNIVKFVNNDFNTCSRIECVYWAQDRLIVCDTRGQVWKSDKVVNAADMDDPAVDIDTMYGAIKISNPAKFSKTLSSWLTAEPSTGDDALTFSTKYDATHKYRVKFAYAFNTEFGPTKASEPRTVYASKPVVDWDGETYPTIKISASSSKVDKNGITSAILYYAVDDASELQVANISYEYNKTTGSFSIPFYGYMTDLSVWAQAPLDAPTSNYTMGPGARFCTMIDGRMYFWGGATRNDTLENKHPRYRIFMGGNPGHLLSVNPVTGGGFVDVEPGTGKYVNAIVKYKTQNGNNIVTALCGSRQTSEELRYNLVPTSASLSQDNTMRSWNAEHVSGSVGCHNSNCAIACEEGLYTVNRYGIALTTMTMEYNSQIRVSYVSDAIKPVFLDDSFETDSYEYIMATDSIIYYGRTGSYRDSLNKSKSKSVVFCYDIDLKAWWSITVPADVCNAINFDTHDASNGVLFICRNALFILPTTNQPDDCGCHEESEPKKIQFADLSTTQPNHGFHHLAQIEFEFDWFKGDAVIEIVGYDIFGREIKTSKKISHKDAVYGLTVRMRVDEKLREYRLRITGDCWFRMTCFSSKVYTLPARTGLVYGFDDEQTFIKSGDIHHTFKNYNDVVNAIIV